ncbi:Bro-N domain-containing protein [Candidatus Saccharibacteria bacterium]|nr:Bro-N domain-containing protein [Candidatus Saccharibacteria bacterium]
MPRNINKIALFEEKAVRKIWDKDNEKWLFSAVDVIAALTNSDNPAVYWRVLKKRLKDEGSETVTFCNGLKMRAPDGKMRLTDVADTEGILRIIESIPSPKAEPFKRWLAKVGGERIAEISDPELAAKRMRSLYEQKGYPKSWIEQRERGIATRHRLTNEWDKRGASSSHDYAILTNEIYKHGFGLNAKEYKEYKNLAIDQNLRDSMTNMELALTNLGETTAAELHQKNNSRGMKALRKDAKDAGGVTKTAREAAEKLLNSPVVTQRNYLDISNSSEDSNSNLLE